MERVLRASGRTEEADFLARYDGGEWARFTAARLRLLAEVPSFIPWPDTGRAWAKHLPDAEVRWLEQFLPAASALQGRIGRADSVSNRRP